MNTAVKTEKKQNRFTKILDDAGRSLGENGDYRFLENLPKQSGKDDAARVPFPYGSQPENKTGWK